jgi:hypothetical protein
MNWFPVLISTAASALLFFGMDNPSRAFSLLPYLAAIALIWVAKEAWNELRSAGAQGQPRQFCQPTKLLTPLRDKTPDPLDLRQSGAGRA